jgi:hypothetical protein
MIAVLGRSIGIGAGAVAAAVLIPFYFPTVGTVMSENIGLTLGGCGFALMWLSLHGHDRCQSALFAFGAGLMGLGLAARAGAMFVLPLLILYAGWYFRGSNRFSFKALAWTASAIGFAFATNAALIALFGVHDVAGFSNFSYTLYGLVTGGHPWEYIHQNVPTLRSLPEAAQASEAYRLALAHLVAHPLDAVLGILRRYNDFIFNGRWFRIEGIGGLRFLFVVVALVGLFRAIRYHRAPSESFILVGTIGTLLSAPFIGDGGMRVHAATVAFSAALTGLGANTIAGWCRRPAPESRDGTGIAPVPIVIAGFVLFFMVSAVSLRGHIRPPIDSFACQENTLPVAFSTVPDAGINLLSTRDILKIKTRAWLGLTLPRGFDELQPPIRFGLVINLSDQRGAQMWITSPTGRQLPRRFNACGRQIGDIFHLNTVQALP